MKWFVCMKTESLWQQCCDPRGIPQKSFFFCEQTGGCLSQVELLKSKLLENKEQGKSALIPTKSFSNTSFLGITDLKKENPSQDE